MKPTEKSPKIDQFIKETMGVDRKGSIESNVCAVCGEPVKEFKNNLSLKEYRISGLCQKCQDSVFAEDE